MADNFSFNSLYLKCETLVLHFLIMKLQFIQLLNGETSVLTSLK